MVRSTWTMSVSGGALLTLLLVQSAGTQQQPAEAIGADWPMYRHDFAGTGYSPLAEINTRNVATLAQVWTYRLQSDAPAPVAAGRGGAGGVNSEVTPIVVNRVMYLPAANRVVALEPETGKEIWRYPVSGGAPSRRGVAYWRGEGNMAPRVIFTAGLTHSPLPDWRLSPFLELGTGAVRIQPKATIISPPNRTEQVAYYGAGLKWYVSRRFIVRADYRSYVIFTRTDKNEDRNEWKAGFAFFF